MINPPNNNKFIGLQDQQTLGQLNDPLQTEQDFLAKRMSQPVPVPGDQNQTMSPMMQQQKGKMQTVQNDPKLQKGSDASYGISGYVNTEKEYKQALQEKNHPNVYSSPAKQTDYPHADSNKSRPYVVNKEKTGTSKDTLFLPKDTYVSKSGLAEDSDIDNAARKAAADNIYNYTKGNKNYNFEYLEDRGKVKYKN